MTRNGTRITFEKYVDTRFNSLDEKVDLIAKNQEISLQTSKTELDRRLAGMNEFREQLEKQAYTFMTKENFDSKFSLIESKIEALQRLVYIGVGIILVLEILFRFLRIGV